MEDNTSRRHNSSNISVLPPRNPHGSDVEVRALDEFPGYAAPTIIRGRAAAPRITKYEDIYKRVVVLRTHLKRFAPEMIPRQARYSVPLKHALAC